MDLLKGKIQEHPIEKTEKSTAFPALIFPSIPFFKKTMPWIDEKIVCKV